MVVAGAAEEEVGMIVIIMLIILLLIVRLLIVAMAVMMGVGMVLMVVGIAVGGTPGLAGRRNSPAEP